MATAKFQTEFPDYPLTVDDLNNEAWTEIFRSYFQNSELLVLEATPYVVGGSGGTDSVNSEMTGVLVRITKTGKVEDAEDVHTVIKSPGSVKFARMLSKVQEPTFRECLWYGVFAPALGEQVVEYLPKCYHCNCSYFDVDVPVRCERCCCFPFYIPFKKAEEGVIILENVCAGPRQYRLYDKHKVIDFKHCSMALTALGHFHGSWWKLMRKMRDASSGHETPCSIDVLSKIFRVKVPLSLMKFMINPMQATIAKFLQSQNEDPELIDRLERFVKHDAMDVIKLVYDLRLNTNAATMNHGDYWSNNMMFCYDSGDNESENPSGVVMLDFQMLSVGHPVVDLYYFLFIGTDAEFRKEYIDSLLEIYFKVYASYWPEESRLKYTYSDFKNDYDEYKVYGYLLGSMVMSNMLSGQPMDREGSLSDHQKKVEREILGATPELRACPKLAEVRRRLLGMVHEMDEGGHFEQRNGASRVRTPHLVNGDKPGNLDS